MPLESDQVRHIRSELQHVRDRVNYLLDKLEPEAPPVLVDSSQASHSEY